MVSRNEDALPFPDMNLLFAVVEQHLARIDVIHRILVRTVDASAFVIIEKTEKDIVIIEKTVIGAGFICVFILYCFYFHTKVVITAE